MITTVIPSTPWNAGETLQLMETERVTVGQGVPTQWRLVLDHAAFETTDLSSLRIAGTGAATVPPDLVREMEAGSVARSSSATRAPKPRSRPAACPAIRPR